MKQKRKGIAGLAIGMAGLLLFSIIFNVLSLTKFDNIFEKFFGATASTLKGDTLGADVQYYKSDFSGPSELYAYEEEKVAQIAAEGITLLENDGILPLAKGTKLSIFSHSSVDLVSGGSGSGSGSFELTKNLKEGLENAGLQVNEALWDFYKSGKGSSYKRGTGVINYGADLDWSINECPLSIITKDSALVSSFDGTYGLGYMLTGLDAAGQPFSASGRLVDTWVYDNFSSPAMQNMGDFAFAGTDYYYINYAEGIYVGYRYYETRYEDVLTCRANAGDYDYSSTVLYPFGYGLSYTTFRWSDFTMSETEDYFLVSVTVTNTGNWAGKDVVHIYAQAPYLGNVEKSAIVLVGFAKTENLKPGASQTVTVTVSKKDLTSYNMHANNGRGGYILDAGNYYIAAAGNAHEALNRILQTRGVEAIEGKWAEGKQDASTAAEGQTMVGVYMQETQDSTTYNVAATGLQPVQNRFPDATLSDAVYLSRSNWQQMDNWGLRYGSASETASRAEIGGKQFQSQISDQLLQALQSFSSLNPAEGQAITSPTFGKAGDIDLIDLRGLAYDDPLWEQLLDQITLEELSKLIDECGYCSPAVPSINKPKVTDLDGPAGLNDIIAHGSMPIGDGLRAMTWPTQYMLACTWDVTLAEDMGRGIAEDGLYADTVGWYGPGMNIHRTPFAGRNFEYYSEDTFLSGALGRAEVNGAAQKGMYAFIKHFALNDQETHRDERGLATFADEQTIRELYLKPFEMTIVDNTVEIFYNEAIRDDNGKILGYEKRTTTVPAATALMTSFNRIGATWAGGHYALITEVLRGEWGFNGFVLTDYEVGQGKGGYMDTLQTLGAGGDAKLKTVGMDALFGFNIAKHPAYQSMGRDAAHHILYTVVNSAGMNGFVHGVEFVNGFAYYKLILIGWDILAAAAMVYMALKIRKRLRKPCVEVVSEEA